MYSSQDSVKLKVRGGLMLFLVVNFDMCVPSSAMHMHEMLNPLKLPQLLPGTVMQFVSVFRL